MSDFFWEHSEHANPRIHYLYKDTEGVTTFCGLVSNVRDGSAYSVYRSNSSINVYSSPQAYVATVPTLAEAKGLLLTIAGAST